MSLADGGGSDHGGPHRPPGASIALLWLGQLSFSSHRSFYIWKYLVAGFTLCYVLNIIISFR